MRKILNLTLIGIMGLTMVPSIFASDATASPTYKGPLKQLRADRQQLNQDRKTAITDIKEQFKDKIASKVAEIKKLVVRAMVLKASITAIGTNSITISKDSKTYTVVIGSNTRLRRRFYGAAQLSEMSVGNQVDVIGKWNDDAHTNIQALLIRDISIQKRYGVFVGTVTAISGNDITFKSLNRGTQKATVTSATKFVNRKEVAIALSDIQVGHRIRIKGMWDNSNNTITEVTNIKDYSLPVMPKVTPTVSPTPTSSPAATPTP